MLDDRDTAPGASARTFLAAAPAVATDLARRWRLELGDPWRHDGCNAWVAPAWQADGTPAVLKLGLPHWEGRDEIAGLRTWDGDPTVRLLLADPDLNAMLLERCDPGTPLRSRPPDVQDRVIAALLHRAWRPRPRAGIPFRHLHDHAAFVRTELEGVRSRWPDAARVAAALADMERLSLPSDDDRLLMTDLHAGNVLAAAREPWLAIDPKPFVGDRAFDGTQHLLNGAARLRRDALGTVSRLADLLEVDADRLRRWLAVRLVASDWGPRWPLAVALARRLGE